MKTKETTSPNRIDFIVQHNPEGARHILERHGYKASDDKKVLSATMKKLVREKGKPVIKELLLIHPEKELILKAAGYDSQELNYCGCKHSSFMPEMTVEGILALAGTLSDENLAKALETAKSRANKDPKNKELREVVDVLQKEFDSRQKKSDNDKDKPSDESWSAMLTDKRFLIGTLVGLLIGFIVTKIS
jgi:hypothetical protein